MAKKSELGVAVAAALEETGNDPAKAIVIEGVDVFFFETESGIQGSTRMLGPGVISDLCRRYNNGMEPPIVRLTRPHEKGETLKVEIRRRDSLPA